jgi:hypothetical protein
MAVYKSENFAPVNYTGGYPGSLGARKRALIQPFQRPLSTSTQFPCRFVTSKRVPLGTIPRTLPFAEGVDLMFTPAGCEKRTSRFWDAGAVWRAPVFPGGAAEANWGEASTGLAAAASGAGEGSGILGAAWIGAAGED